MIVNNAMETFTIRITLESDTTTRSKEEMKAVVRASRRLRSAARQHGVAKLDMGAPGSFLVARQSLGPSPFVSFSTKPRASPPPLPEPLVIDVDDKCKIEYIDVKPEDLSAATPTLVLIHGAPGTYRDFRHLIPLLKDRGVRVVGVNLPGFAGSTILDTTNYYDHISAFPSVQLTYKAMQGVLKASDNVFVLGHSFGGHAAVHFTGINADEQRINIKGLVLLAGAGHRPHQALSPRLNDFLWKMLRSGLPMIESTSKWLVRQLYIKSFKFPDSKLPDYFTAGIVRCATADFPLFARHLEKNRALPSFLAWAKDDALIEEEIFLDVSAVCHPGPRLAFKKGGHNVQKTKAAFLADELTDWMDNVVQGKEQSEVYSTNVEIHP
ncbi:hypothetical protein F441_13910 [Phytophthora nicotianae CJ01A1]|uniref:AB hydrolase-1 domain-containing protein n=3 Tax=Phytophthora nicotianae TaxID=4792 RepID=W2YXE4_PHYNI|nr:hypothetical protein L915_13618 [Phytophthora nicotianae]ETP10462.1 hypothetical protein F441_13910 [Phytophthora nicotianae CJ01A1]ETP38634.1 hypothetical protein F442_13819 [Phytophthora nicotianae P10297]ETL34223.1 hypothetical protein L916_13515 [Phytophthora nicotianae]ETL87505.1 hypothetical protein L917_13326 [Phytophthora nicotianae]